MMRNTKEVLYLKYAYTDQEKMQMGDILARSLNDLDDLEAEEAAFKAQIKNRKAGLQVTVQTLSRNISAGYEMRNTDCAVQWDTPNVNEVRYVRLDTGEVAKERPMTEQERQMELPIVAGPVLVMTSAEESIANAEAFFGQGSIDALRAEDAGNSAIADEEEEDEDEQMTDQEDVLAVFSNPDPAAANEATKPEHDAAWVDPGDQPRRGRGRPKGSTKKAEEEQF